MDELMDKNMNYLEKQEFLKKVFPNKDANADSRIFVRIGMNHGFMYDINLGKKMMINVENIYPCQDVLSERKVNEIIESTKSGTELMPPSGIKLDEKVYILDGHHRAAAQILSGKKNIEIRVLEITQEEYDSELAKRTIRRGNEHSNIQAPNGRNEHKYNAEERAKRDAEADKRRKEIRECGGLREYLELKFKAENMI